MGPEYDPHQSKAPIITAMSTPDSTITIFHNPNCSTSRKTLALLRERGIEPTIVEYLRTPPDKERLRALLSAMDMPVRDLLRAKEAVYEELGLDDPELTDEQLLDAVMSYPILMNRPIVETPLGTRLARPMERVLEVLPPAGD